MVFLTQVGQNFRKRLTLHIKSTGDKLYEYMSTREGKEKILHPEGCISIEDDCHSPEECAREVRLRFRRFIDSYLKSEEIANEPISIQKETEKFYEETLLKISAMENEWSSTQREFKRNVKLTGILFTTAVVLFGLSLSPMLATTATTAAAAATAAAGIVWVGLTLYRHLRDLSLKRDELKRQAINAEYKHCMSDVRRIVSDQLEETVGTVLGKLIDKVTEKEIPRHIESLEKMIQQLQKSGQRIKDKLIKLINLERRIIEMENNIFKFKNELKQYELQVEENTLM